MLNTIQLALSIILLIAGIPIGLLLAKITKQEKPIHKKYFPIILWILAIAAGVFYTLDLLVGVSLTFIFITVLFWNHADKFKRKKNTK